MLASGEEECDSGSAATAKALVSISSCTEQLKVGLEKICSSQNEAAASTKQDFAELNLV